MARICSTRDKIVDMAISLLNARGLQNVTVRDIANQLNISVGNFTYHFPKWDNLMDEIVDRLMNDLEEMKRKNHLQLSSILEYVNDIYTLQVKYIFIFSNFYLFFLTYPKYRETTIAFVNERMENMRQSLELMIKEGYLYPFDKEKHNYDLVVKNIWVHMSSWCAFSIGLANNEFSSERDKKGFFLSLWNICAYHLTEKGLKTVREAFDKYSWI